MFDWWKEFESVSSSSQARHGEINNRLRMRAIEEVALLRSVSVNLAELRRVFGIEVALRRSVSVNLAELWRVLETNVESDEESFMKVGGSRPGV